MASSNRVSFDLEAARSGTTATGFSNDVKSPSIHSEPELSQSPTSIKRRQTRKLTKCATIDEHPSRPNWRPGQEPGLDPSKPNGGRPSEQPTRHEECQVTVVDYSVEKMRKNEFDNAGLIDFLKQKQESWITCRWININGLSWDVIQALGRTKGLHKLALEDLLNTSNRTKADW